MDGEHEYIQSILELRKSEQFHNYIQGLKRRMEASKPGGTRKWFKNTKIFPCYLFLKNMKMKIYFTRGGITKKVAEAITNGLNNYEINHVASEISAPFKILEGKQLYSIRA